jgi:hypothetical protein
METVLEVIQAVKAVEQEATAQFYLSIVSICEPLSLEKASKRIPDHMKDTHPYSALALWTFYARTHHDPEGETCNYCSMFDGQTFTGAQLRSVFPDHHWEGDDIYPDVHKTLWGKSGTCACLLIREPSENATVFEMWSRVGVDWKEQPKEEEDEI